MNDLRRCFMLFVAFAVLAGCTPFLPYRTEKPDASVDCSPDLEGRVPDACAKSVLERTKDYDLMFVEFDDQGLQYPVQKVGTPAAYQINLAMERLSELMHTYEGVSVVVFVHGWNHNAKADDENVRTFRQLLNSAAALEEVYNSRHRVVGIYVGWRGLATNIPLLREATFWSRKAAATHVAEGSSRELLSRLRAFRCDENAKAAGTDGCSEPAKGTRPAVRTLMIGHSFGGLILYNAVSGSLTEGLTADADRRQPGLQMSRFADMVVLLNPAFEATRYTPLHRIATTRKYTSYEAPIFVSITSTADLATREAFPLGRSINSVFERTASEEEAVANVNTIGHVPEYITHKLGKTAEEPCPGWKNVLDVPEAQRREQMRENLRAERLLWKDFMPGATLLPSGWKRVFCGGAQLEHVRHDPNSVIWNVEADPSVIASHGDIYEPTLTAFVRQLYHQTYLAAGAR